MKLQTRLALTFGVVVTLATVVMGGLSFAAISSRLTAQTDDSLLETAVPLAAQLRGGRIPDDGEPHGRRRDQELILPAQLLLPDGRVLSASTSEVTLPVDNTDREIAGAARATTRFRDVQVDGRPYRMVTQGAGNGAGASQVGRDQTENQAVLATLAVLLALIALAVSVLAALAGWLLARRSARRLVGLTDAAEQIAATGSLQADVEVAGKDEIARLGGAFNAMILRLSQAQADQQRLVQDAGHELRTPLTSLRTNVSLLRRFEDMPAATRERVIADLDGETKELTHLVNEIVHLAGSGPVDSPPVPVALAPIVTAVAERVRRRTGMALTTSCDDTFVLGQPASVERAVWNLVDNAIKFSFAGSPIELRSMGGTVAVLDRGPGIDPADLNHVFDRFYRATASRSRPGSGLGLAIVRDVATKSGGGVYARNREGGGAEVGFWIPPYTGPDPAQPPSIAPTPPQAPGQAPS